MAYYINLFTEETWRESRLNAGWEVSGHTERLRNRDRIDEGDVFLCWITKISAFVGALRVTGPAFEVEADGPRIWGRALYPLRFPTELEVRVPVAEGVTLSEVRMWSDDDPLWGWVFRNSGNAIPDSEAEWVMDQLRGKTQLTVPDDEPPLPEPAEEEEPARPRRDTGHSAAQLQLAKIGRQAGLDVWIARNDRSTMVDGERLGDFSVDSLPEWLPAEVRRTIELIDVVWLKRNIYVSAFEIEATTPVFTGLQRMGDLMAAAPNLQIPLFVVAPEEKRQRVFTELGRPLFRFGLDPPLEEICRYIAFGALEEAFQRYGDSPGLDAGRLVDQIAESAQ